MPSIVALDIETTGLDSAKDVIIEIGAVRFNGHRIEDEWSSLINPGRPIPPFITRLTGITNEMVARAPYIQDVYADLVEFVGNAPILGHNIQFDLSFLRRRGGLLDNQTIDTYEMAAVILPRAERYNLGALGETLNIPLPATHRALDDARVTRAVYSQLYELAQSLPVDLLAEIVRMAEPLDWAGNLPFRQALRAAASQPIKAKQARHTDLGPIFAHKPARISSTIKLNPSPTPLDIAEVAALLEYGGAFSRHFPAFEYRPEQVEMLRAVADAISDNHHLMVEAGTGTGKSVAYLVPAAVWAVQNESRVVISTNTINLQDQLIKKDIPDVRAALGLNLRAAIMKGRGNYLCPRRLENMRRRDPETVEELRVLAKVLVWLRSTTSGDRGEINLNGPVEREIWSRLSADDDGCTAEICQKRTGGACPFYRAKQDAQNAHILIVNHALLLSDIATGSRVLPEYDHLIIDEAHHMESATTNALSFHASQVDLERMLRELGSHKSGSLGRLLTIAQDILNPDQLAALHYLAEQTGAFSFQLENKLREFFYLLDHFLYEQRQGSGPGAYAQQERILPATRTQPAWMEVEVSWDDADVVFKALIQAFGDILKAAGEMTEFDLEEITDIFGSLSNLYRRFYEAHQHIDGLVFNPEPDQIYWVEISPNGGRLTLHSAPLHIGSLMQNYVWNEKSAVILTSATLTTAGEFDYLKQRLGAEDADEVALGSPFDFESSALLFIANDIPEPNDRSGHQRAIEHSLIHLTRATGGRTLVLFTSYDQLRKTSTAITPVLAKYGIQVYEQGEGASPHALLESFKTTQQAVLLGTRSFWEGVDIPGEALSVLVITKLPFDVPSDPVIAARSETYEDAFYQYQLPEAILRFRQGFGRLIRTQSDRGVVAILDRRVLTKRYGKNFIDSLPTCTTRVGPLADLPHLAAQWLNL